MLPPRHRMGSRALETTDLRFSRRGKKKKPRRTEPLEPVMRCCSLGQAGQMDGQQEKSLTAAEDMFSIRTTCAKDSVGTVRYVSQEQEKMRTPRTCLRDDHVSRRFTRLATDFSTPGGAADFSVEASSPRLLDHGYCRVIGANPRRRIPVAPLRCRDGLRRALVSTPMSVVASSHFFFFLLCFQRQWLT